MTPLNRIGSTTAALALLLLSTLTFLPQVRAANSDWTMEVVPNLSDTIAEGNLAHDGERLGFVYKYLGTGANGKIGFSLRAVNGTWAQKTGDVSGAAILTAEAPIVAHVSGAIWLIAYSDTPGGWRDEIWRTTNDGATWSQVYRIGTTGGGACGAAIGNVRDHDVKVASGTIPEALLCTSDSLGFVRSTDLGATWSSIFQVSDNQGSPSGACTACVVSGQAALTPNSPYQAFYGTNTNQLSTVQSSDGAFWDVSFGSGSPTCTRANLAATPCYLYAPSSGAISLPSVKGEGTPLVSWNDVGGWESYVRGSLTYVSTGTGISPQVVATCSAGRVNGVNHVAIAGNAGDVYVSAQTCTGSPAGLTVRLKSGSGAWTLDYTSSAAISARDVTVDMTPQKSWVLYTNSALGDRVEAISRSTPTASVPTSSVAVSSLVGFDVDDSGAVAIARLSGGTNVQVFNGQTLAAGAVATDADCSGKLDGVSAYASATDVYTTYFECSNSGSHPANSMKVRSGTLGSPVAPAACDQFTTGDLTTASLFNGINVPDTLREISSLGLFPIDFSNCDDSGTVGHVLLTWAFSTTNGQVGEWAVTEDSLDNQNSATAFITYDGAGSSPAQMCSWFVGGKDHIGAVGSPGSKFYLPTADAHTSALNWYPDAAISLDYTLGGAFSTASGLSCAQYRGVIINPAGVAVICTVAGHCPTGVSTGQPLWTPKVPSGTVLARSAVISANSQWAAYLDNAGIHILNATSGVEKTVFAEPESGIFWEMRMDASAGSIWLAYTDHIYRYDISAYTCGLNCTNTQVPVPTSTSSSSSTVGGFLGLTPGAFDVNGNGDATSGGMLMSLLLIIGMAAVCAGIIPGKNPTTMVWGAGVGALLGFGWTVFMGIMPPLITFILIVIGVVVLGFRFKGGLKESG